MGLESLEFLASAASAFSPTELASLAWAVAALRLGSSQALLETIAGTAICTLQQFRARNLANTSWAFAVMRFEHRPFLLAVALQTISSIANFGVQSLSNMSWAFARLNVFDVPLLAAISLRASELLG